MYQGKAGKQIRETWELERNGVRTRTRMYATIAGEMTPEPQPAGTASSVRTTCADLVFFMSASTVGS